MSLVGVPAYDIYNGESISKAIMPMIGAIISIPIVYFIFSRFLRSKIIQEHEALIERTIQ